VVTRDGLSGGATTRMFMSKRGPDLGNGFPGLWKVAHLLWVMEVGHIIICKLLLDLVLEICGIIRPLQTSQLYKRTVPEIIG
jgi:hypothetical protein